MSARLTPAVATQIAAIVKPSNLLLDAAMTSSYSTDWTSRWTGQPSAVVRPGTSSEVAAVLRVARAVGLPVVPQGGNTSLVGGSVPRGGELLLSTSRMRAVESVNVADRSAVVQAGVPLQAVQEALAREGFAFGVDLAARGTATIGGMAATNAGGLNVVANGAMADNIAGIEVALADGTLIDRLDGLRKDTAGYDLRRLFVGSEGTLGVITRIALRMIRPPAQRAAVLVALSSVESAVALTRHLVDALPHIRSVEFFRHEGMLLVCGHARLAHPFPEPHPCYLFVEVGGPSGLIDELATALDGSNDVTAEVVAASHDEVNRLFAYRERHTEAIAALGVAHKFDVAVPLDRVAPFIAELDRRLPAELPGATCISFGHLAEGNLHVNVVPAAGTPPDAVEDAVLGLVLEHRGTISAEHGIGIAKARWLERMRGPADVAAMRAIKAALDPAWILNPGVIFPALGTPGTDQ